MGQCVMAVPPVLLESCENIMGTICNISGNVDITEMDDVERCGETQGWYCELNPLQVCQEIPGDDQRDPGDADGVNGGAYAEEEED